MNNLQAVQPISVDNIKTKIYEFREQKVMLDRDLAALYQVNQKIKRSGKTKHKTVSNRFYVSIKSR